MTSAATSLAMQIQKNRMVGIEVCEEDAAAEML